MEELLSLKWNNHRSTFLHILTILRDKQLYTDATLACEGRFYSVHRLVLSTCSDYFSAIFDRTTCKNPTVVLKDIKCEDLEALLDYMYLGEVNVRQAELASLIKAAECLRVKGLAVPDDEPPRKGGRSDSNKLRNSDVAHSPPPKRKRREVSEDSRDDIRQSSSTNKTTQSQSRLSPISQEPLTESGRASSKPIQSTDSSLTNNIPLENQTFVKMEMEDSGGGDDIGGTFNVSNDGYKEEEGDAIEDPGGDLSNDLPEFLQQATGSHLSGGSFSHGSFAGTSSFQPGDIGWQGEGSNLNFPGQLNFSPTDSSSQNAPGVSLNSTSLSSLVPSLNAALTSESLGGGGSAATTMCIICGKNFHSMWHMTRHLRTHTGERPFPCPFCPYAATQKNALQRHIQNVHGLETGSLYHGVKGINIGDLTSRNFSGKGISFRDGSSRNFGGKGMNFRDGLSRNHGGKGTNISDTSSRNDSGKELTVGNKRLHRDDNSDLSHGRKGMQIGDVASLNFNTKGIAKTKQRTSEELPPSPSSQITSFAALLDSNILESNQLPFSSTAAVATSNISSTSTTTTTTPLSTSACSEMTSLPSFSRALSNVISGNNHPLSSALLLDFLNQ